MAIIDPEGRLLGKINIVDLVVVALVIAAAFLAQSMFIGQEKSAYISILVDPANEFVIKNIGLGDKEYSMLSGNRIGEIVALQSIPSFTDKKMLVAVIKATVSSRNTKNYYKDNIISVGREIEFETDKAILKGKIIGISDTLENATKAKPLKYVVKVSASNTPWFIAQSIAKGRINSFAEITDTKYFPYNSTHGDILMKIRVDAVEFEGTILFNNAPLAAKKKFEISEPVNLVGTIEEFSPAEKASLLLAEKTKEQIALIDAGVISVPEYNNIPVAGVEATQHGQPIAEILSKESIYVSRNSRKTFIVAKVYAAEKKNTLEFKGKPFISGKEIALEPRGTIINGKIITIANPESNRQFLDLSEGKTIIKAKAYGIEPFVADKIIVGKTEADSLAGETITLVLGKKEANAEIILTTETGTISKQKHPENKDLELELELLTTKDNSGRTFHKNDALLVGSIFQIEFNDAKIQVKILGIEDGK